jgi:hypothetical protein
MKKIIVVVLALGLSGCASVASGITTVVQSVSSSTPTQVTTLADAVSAATLVTQAVDVYVNTASPNKATLLELQTLNNGVHAALVSLEAANTANQSLAIAAFNAALTAFSSYATAVGVPH